MKLVVLILLSLSLASCKTVHFNREEVLNRQNSISLLSDRLEQARANDVNFLAPSSFADAQKKLEKAIDEAQKQKNQDAGDITAKEGIALIDQAEQIAERARHTLEAALKKRIDAQNAQAHLLFESEYSVLEEQLKAAGKALESGDEKTGLEQNARLATEFTKLEVKSLKMNISEQAELAFKQSKQADADSLAPITYKNAKRELEIARKIIDVEKDNYDQAKFHAKRAQYLALRAKSIAELITQFRKENLSKEQMILWFQDQLQTIHSPLGEELQFDTSAPDTTKAFFQALSSRLSYLKQLESRALEAEKKIATLKDQVAASSSDEVKSELDLARREENFRMTSELFQEDEAEILRRNDDIIIRAYGFYFPVGSSELLPRNFALLNKIVNALVKFPKAQFVVEGHTDSTGGKSLNMRLSRARSQNIAEFLIKLAGVDPTRVSSVGLGDTKPLESNDNAEGRAKNRRIEIVIKN